MFLNFIWSFTCGRVNKRKDFQFQLRREWRQIPKVLLITHNLSKKILWILSYKKYVYTCFCCSCCCCCCRLESLFCFFSNGPSLIIKINKNSNCLENFNDFTKFFSFKIPFFLEFWKSKIRTSCSKNLLHSVILDEEHERFLHLNPWSTH